MRVTHFSNGLNDTKLDEKSIVDQDAKSATALSQLRALAGLCNSAEFDAATESLPTMDRKVFGDATDSAILRFSEFLAPVAELRRQWKKTFELAFNSKDKYMIATYVSTDGSGPLHALHTQEAHDFMAEDL